MDDGFIYNSDSTTFIYWLYISIGTLSVLCNTLNLCIWLSRAELRQKYIYLVALDVCEFVNAISYILTGIGRRTALLENSLSSPINMRRCFSEKYWPHLIILGTQLPSFTIILISCERLCAVLRPAAYNRIFTGRAKIALLTLIPLAGAVSLLAGGLSTTGRAGDQTFFSQHCGISGSTSFGYTTFHYVFVVVAYVIAFVVIYIVRRISKKSSNGKVGGDNRFGVMLITTGSSIILIGSESIVQLFLLWKLMLIQDVVLGVTHAMPACLSILNTLINIVFRLEFRKQFFLIIHSRNTSFHRQSVKPLTIQVRPL